MVLLSGKHSKHNETSQGVHMTDEVNTSPYEYEMHFTRDINIRVGPCPGQYLYFSGITADTGSSYLITF